MKKASKVLKEEWAIAMVVIRKRFSQEVHHSSAIVLKKGLAIELNANFLT